MTNEHKHKNLLYKCIHCKSENYVKQGFRRTENRGKLQKFFCRDCKQYFTENNGFYRIRNSPQKITCALDLFYRGLSTREVQNHFKAFSPHNSDHSTILRWIKKYALRISNFTDKLKVKTGCYMEVDEMEFQRRRSHRRKLGIDKNWLINAIDVKTRYLVNSAYEKHRSKKAIRELLTRVKAKTGNNIGTIKTDGLTAYKNVVRKTFGYNNRFRVWNIKHEVANASAGDGFNIWVERLHNTIRQRTKGFRGLHGSVDSAYALMKGFEVYYNFIKKHEALKGKTPSELAIPYLKFKGANRWIELIKMASP